MKKHPDAYPVLQHHLLFPSKTGSSKSSTLAALYHSRGAVSKVKREDHIRFGMSIDPYSSCCVEEKIKTGRTKGCCAHISTEDFKQKIQKCLYSGNGENRTENQIRSRR